MMFAAALNHPEIVLLLLEARADKDLIANSGSTALNLACRAGHADIALMLLRAGARRFCRTRRLERHHLL